MNKSKRVNGNKPDTNNKDLGEHQGRHNSNKKTSRADSSASWRRKEVEQKQEEKQVEKQNEGAEKQLSQTAKTIQDILNNELSEVKCYYTNKFIRAEDRTLSGIYRHLRTSAVVLPLKADKNAIREIGNFLLTARVPFTLSTQASTQNPHFVDHAWRNRTLLTAVGDTLKILSNYKREQCTLLNVQIDDLWSQSGRLAKLCYDTKLRVNSFVELNTMADLTRINDSTKVPYDLPFKVAIINDVYHIDSRKFLELKEKYDAITFICSFHNGMLGEQGTKGFWFRDDSNSIRAFSDGNMQGVTYTHPDINWLLDEQNLLIDPKGFDRYVCSWFKGAEYGSQGKQLIKSTGKFYNIHFPTSAYDRILEYIQLINDDQLDLKQWMKPGVSYSYDNLVGTKIKTRQIWGDSRLIKMIALRFEQMNGQEKITFNSMIKLVNSFVLEDKLLSKMLDNESFNVDQFITSQIIVGMFTSSYNRLTYGIIKNSCNPIHSKTAEAISGMATTSISHYIKNQVDVFKVVKFVSSIGVLGVGIRLLFKNKTIHNFNIGGRYAAPFMVLCYIIKTVIMELKTRGIGIKVFNYIKNAIGWHGNQTSMPEALNMVTTVEGLNTDSSIITTKEILYIPKIDGNVPPVTIDNGVSVIQMNEDPLYIEPEVTQHWIKVTGFCACWYVPKVSYVNGQACLARFVNNMSPVDIAQSCASSWRNDFTKYWKPITDKLNYEPIVVTRDEIVQWISKVKVSRKRERYLAALKDYDNGMDVKIEIKVHPKTDEFLLLKFDTEDQPKEPKIRPIAAPDTSTVIRIQPAIDYATQNAKKYFTIDNALVDNNALLYTASWGAGQTQDYLNSWLANANITLDQLRTEVHMIAAGDDMLMVIHNAGDIFYIMSDFSAYDQSIVRVGAMDKYGPLQSGLEFVKLFGGNQESYDILDKLYSCDFIFSRKDDEKVMRRSIVKKKYDILPTGVSTTTFNNTCVTIMATFMSMNKIVSQGFDFDTFSRELETEFLKYNFKAKIKTTTDITQADFLKGTWLFGEGSYWWTPLPGQALKWGGIKDIQGLKLDEKNLMHFVKNVATGYAGYQFNFITQAIYNTMHLSSYEEVAGRNNSGVNYNILLDIATKQIEKDYTPYCVRYDTTIDEIKDLVYMIGELGYAKYISHPLLKRIVNADYN